MPENQIIRELSKLYPNQDLSVSAKGLQGQARTDFNAGIQRLADEHGISPRQLSLMREHELVRRADEQDLATKPYGEALASMGGRDRPDYGAGSEALKGFTWGLSDKAIAGGQGLWDFVKDVSDGSIDQSLGEHYNNRHNAREEESAAYRAVNPIEGAVADIGGGLVSFNPASKIKAAETLWGLLGQQMVLGGAQGFAEGAFRSDADTGMGVLKDAGVGSLWGGGIGGVVQGVGSAIGAGANATKSLWRNIFGEGGGSQANIDERAAIEAAEAMRKATGGRELDEPTLLDMFSSSTTAYPVTASPAGMSILAHAAPNSDVTTDKMLGVAEDTKGAPDRLLGTIEQQMTNGRDYYERLDGEIEKIKQKYYRTALPNKPDMEIPTAELQSLLAGNATIKSAWDKVLGDWGPRSGAPPTQNLFAKPKKPDGGPGLVDAQGNPMMTDTVSMAEPSPTQMVSPMFLHEVSLQLKNSKNGELGKRVSDLLRISDDEFNQYSHEYARLNAQKRAFKEGENAARATNTTSRMFDAKNRLAREIKGQTDAITEYRPENVDSVIAALREEAASRGENVADLTDDVLRPQAIDSINRTSKNNVLDSFSDGQYDQLYQLLDSKTRLTTDGTREWGTSIPNSIVGRQPSIWNERVTDNRPNRFSAIDKAAETERDLDALNQVVGQRNPHIMQSVVENISSQIPRLGALDKTYAAGMIFGNIAKEGSGQAMRRINQKIADKFLAKDPKEITNFLMLGKALQEESERRRRMMYSGANTIIRNPIIEYNTDDD